MNVLVFILLFFMVNLCFRLVTGRFSGKAAAVIAAVLLTVSPFVALGIIYPVG